MLAGSDVGGFGRINCTLHIAILIVQRVFTLCRRRSSRVRVQPRHVCALVVPCGVRHVCVCACVCSGRVGRRGEPPRSRGACTRSSVIVLNIAMQRFGKALVGRSPNHVQVSVCPRNTLTDPAQRRREPARSLTRRHGGDPSDRRQVAHSALKFHWKRPTNFIYFYASTHLFARPRIVTEA